MKDYKAEADLLRGELKQTKEQIEWLRRRLEEIQVRNEQTRDKFKDLLIDVLGR